MTKTIQKDRIGDLVSKLSDFDVYGPVLEDGVYSYKKVTQAPLTDFINSRKPPKEFFFPQTERMFDFKLDGFKLSGVKELEPSDKDVVLFGIRPCDARAAVLLDTVFKWDYMDPYYIDKRERTTTIAYTCKLPFLPQQNCFCTSVGGNPSSTEGVDMLFTDIGESYFVESLTEKGNKILDVGGELFSDASGDDASKAQETKTQSEGAIIRKLDMDGVVEALEKSFSSDHWDKISESCIGCGICTLMCPTCHCFDINDIINKGEAWRERNWDSCQYPYYSIHASGHNPRPAKMHRQRNRVYHKFLYMTKNLGVVGCVGCGRCITGCPENIDIIDMVEGAKEGGI